MPHTAHESAERDGTAAGTVQMHVTQREQLRRLSRQPGVRAVEVLEVSLVTDSVQVIALVRRKRRTQRVLIAPSGRLHQLP